MGDEESADGGGGLYAVAIGEGYAETLPGSCHVEEDALQGMVGTDGISDGRADELGPCGFGQPAVYPLGRGLDDTGTEGMVHETFVGLLVEVVGRRVFGGDAEESDGYGGVSGQEVSQRAAVAVGLLAAQHRHAVAVVEADVVVLSAGHLELQESLWAEGSRGFQPAEQPTGIV